MQLQFISLFWELIGQGQGIQFAFYGEQAKDGGQGSIKIQGFIGDFLPLMARHGRKGAQIMQPVSEFYNHHLGFGCCTAKDLAVNKFTECLLVAGMMGDLGTSLDYGLHIGTKLFSDYIGGYILHILYSIMKQGCSQNFGIVDIQFFGKDAGHTAGVHNI